MTSRPPTPQGISRLLADAGHTRYTAPGARVADGFKVARDRDDARRVLVWQKIRASRDPDRAKAALAAYADTIRSAGWTVQAGEYELTVTAPKTEG